MNGWDEKLGVEDLEVVRGAGMLLLQREIPDWVNLQVAQVNLGFPCLVKDATSFFKFVVVQRMLVVQTKGYLICKTVLIWFSIEILQTVLVLRLL